VKEAAGVIRWRVTRGSTPAERVRYAISPASVDRAIDAERPIVEQVGSPAHAARGELFLSQGRKWL